MTSTLPSFEHDFPGWYGDVARRAELAEHSAVRGSMVIRPYGYAIWELLQRALDDRRAKPTWSRGSRRRSRW
jgi:prolyl-tRNA synthetase